MVGLRLGFRRYLALSYLADLSHLATERDLRRELRGEITRYSRRGLQAGWSARTTAAILASLRSAYLAQELDHDRRMRVGRVLTEQDSSGVNALEWLVDFTSGRLNVVGTDSFVLRYNYTSGLLASWIVGGKAVDPHVRPIFIALSAWALAGLEQATLADRLKELLCGMSAEPADIG